jgi:ankyrin repeat protein
MTSLNAKKKAIVTFHVPVSEYIVYINQVISTLIFYYLVIMFNTVATRRLKTIINTRSPRTTVPGPLPVEPPLEHRVSVFREIRHLLLSGANPNVIAEDSDDDRDELLTPLFFAMKHNEMEMVKLLVLRYNVKVNGKRRENLPIFFLSTIPDFPGKEEILDFLLDSGSPIDGYITEDQPFGAEGYTPLHMACSVFGRRINFVYALLNHGANPNAQVDDGENLLGATPLDLAIIGTPDDILEKLTLKLIQCGFNVNIQDSSGDTALHTCVGYAQLKCTTVLLSNGARIMVNCQGNEPLYSFIDDADRMPFLIGLNNWLADRSLTLVDFGADPNKFDKYGENLIYHALASLDDDKFAHMLNIFLSKGVDLNIRYPPHDNNTILHTSILMRKLKSTIALLETGLCDNTMRNDNFQTPLEMVGKRVDGVFRDEFRDEFRDSITQWARKRKIGIFDNASYQHGRANSLRLRRAEAEDLLNEKKLKFSL